MAPPLQPPHYHVVEDSGGLRGHPHGARRYIGRVLQAEGQAKSKSLLSLLRPLHASGPSTRRPEAAAPMRRLSSAGAVRWQAAMGHRAWIVAPSLTESLEGARRQARQAPASAR
jgi:hypothetical protein